MTQKIHFYGYKICGDCVKHDISFLRMLVTMMICHFCRTCCYVVVFVRESFSFRKGKMRRKANHLSLSFLLCSHCTGHFGDIFHHFFQLERHWGKSISKYFFDSRNVIRRNTCSYFLNIYDIRASYFITIFMMTIFQ